jgi:hypothetical protein
VNLEGEGPQPAEIVFQMETRPGGKLAYALPRGTVRVMMPDQSGRMQFAGETRSQDTAIGERWELLVGESGAVMLDVEEVDFQTRSIRGGAFERVTTTLRVEATNALAEPAEIDLLISPANPRNGTYNQNIRGPARPRLEDGVWRLRVTVPPGGRKIWTVVERHDEGDPPETDEDRYEDQ